MSRRIPVLVICAAIAWYYALSAFPISQPSPPSALEALIVTGQNNHDWTRSSKILRHVLEQTGLFRVDLVFTQPKGEGMTGFSPSFAAYDVVIVDYNGESWPEEITNSFVDYVESGGGVVFYHASNNSFPGWQEYNRMTGLGGWGGRDETAGPYLRWRKGEVIQDMSPGKGGSHGTQHEFQIVTRNRDHPITAGLPAKWMHAKDELYDRLRGPAENLTLLATAYSSPEQGGTGEHEPILFTVRYGEGRVFHTVLGHTWEGMERFPALECAGFIVTFQRGAEWAATGNVTKEIPYDFPTATQVRTWKNHEPPSLSSLLAAISSYEYPQSREPLAELHDFIRFAHDSPELLTEIENRLIEFLQSDATLAAKQFLCRELGMIGSEQSVPALTVMLLDTATSDMARYALQRIPGTAVDAALREALGRTSGLAKVGIINSLGERRDFNSVALIRPLVFDTDSEIALASASALGHISGEEATEALAEARQKSTAELHSAVVHAYLKCADQWADDGKLTAAKDIYDRLYNEEDSVPVRMAAVRGKIGAAPGQAGSIIVNVLQEEKNERIVAVAIQLVSEIPGTEEIRPIVEMLPTISIPGQIQLLAALAARGDKSYHDSVISAYNSEEPEVRVAALKAVAKLGNARDVDWLVKVAASGGPVQRDVARESLYRLQGPEVDATILERIPDAGPEVKIELIRCVDKRVISQGSDILLKEARNDDPRVRSESYKAISTVATEDHLPSIIGLLTNAQTEQDRTELEKSVVAVARTISEEDRRTEGVRKALPTVEDPHARASLLVVMGKIGDPAALPVLRRALTDRDSHIQTAAIRALSTWPTPEPLEDLFTVVESRESQLGQLAARLRLAPPPYNTIQKTVALRGVIRLIAAPGDKDSGKTVALFQRAMDLAWDPREKKMILSELSSVESPEALEMAVACLGEESVRNEAEVAVLNVSQRIVESHPEKSRVALKELVETSDNSERIEKAQKMLGLIQE